jgi:hypothetical protein
MLMNKWPVTISTAHGTGATEHENTGVRITILLFLFCILYYDSCILS